jgi:hypothetical protein
MYRWHYSVCYPNGQQCAGHLKSDIAEAAERDKKVLKYPKVMIVS